MKKLINLLCASAVLASGLASSDAFARYPILKDRSFKMWSYPGRDYGQFACKNVYQWVGPDREIVNAQINGFKLQFASQESYGRSRTGGIPHEKISEVEVAIYNKRYDSDNGSLTYRLCATLDGTPHLILKKPIIIANIKVSHMAFDLDD